jgi:hypothetical protein
MALLRLTAVAVTKKTAIVLLIGHLVASFMRIPRAVLLETVARMERAPATTTAAMGGSKVEVANHRHLQTVAPRVTETRRTNHLMQITCQHQQRQILMHV